MAASRPATTASLLALQEAGRGEPVLPLNGGLMSMAAWDAVAEPIVVPDPGRARVAEAPERLAAVLLEFLARSGQKGAYS